MGEVKRRDGGDRLSERIRGDAAERGMAAARSRVEQLLEEGRVRAVGVGDDPFLVERADYVRHSGVLDMIDRRRRCWRASANEELLATVLARMGFAPDPQQREAIVAAIENPVTIVYGGPGTGKSAVIKAIARYLDVLEENRTQVVTAFAAKIAMTTGAKAGLQATTLHALTGTRPGEEEAGAGAIAPEVGTIYVDEAFAVGPGLIHRLLRQAPSDTRVVFVGDPAQLPPIGAGRLLHDVLRAGEVPATALRTSHRLGPDGHLAGQAALVAEGRTPRAGKGLEILLAPRGRRRDVDRIKANCALETRARRAGDGRSVVVLTMTRHGECGHEAIARRIAGSPTPREGHQVITTERHPEGLWRNGQAGTVLSRVDGMMEIAFERGLPVWTSVDDARIAYGYAMSVHRAQGLEYDECILVLAKADVRMLSRQALVSAMTRAPHCTLITDEGVLERAVMRDELEGRAPIAESIAAKRRKR